MKLSIVTISFNAEKCIERTILSILNQDKPVYEYIIVDGGSSDQTMKIVNSYKNEFLKKGIKFIAISETDKGISDAFNKGIKLSTGDLIGLVNADDELMNTANKVLEDVFEKDIDVYYGNCIWEDSQNNLRYVSKPKEIKSSKLNRLLYEMVMIHPSTFIAKKAYLKNGLYDTSFRYCMDQELLYRMYKNGASFKYVDTEFTKFKSGGVSDSNPRKVFAETARIPLMNGESKKKVFFITQKKLIRDYLARKAKKVGLYHLIKRQI